MTKIKGILSVLVVTFLLLHIPVSIAEPYYPSADDFNERSILNEDIWAKFENMGGFSNQPNATANSTSIQVELTHKNHTYIIYLDPINISDYKNFDNTGYIIYVDEIVLQYSLKYHNITNTTRVGVIRLNGYTGGKHTLTAGFDVDGNIDIFWMREYLRPDVPTKYHIFYSQIDANGNVTESNRLFYFEEKASPGAIPPVYEMIYFYIGLVLTIIGVMIYKYYRSSIREKAEEELLELTNNDDNLQK